MLDSNKRRGKRPTDEMREVLYGVRMIGGQRTDARTLSC